MLSNIPSKRSSLFISVSLSVGLLSGCFESSPNADLEQFVIDVASKPTGIIEPIPEFSKYESFHYRAFTLRSPFSLPSGLNPEPVIDIIGTVEPDSNRTKEILESYSLDELMMVGTIKRNDGKLWAFIRTSDDLIYRVCGGNYIGKNNGRIIHVSETLIKITEIIPNGFGGWAERSVIVALQDLEDLKK